MKEKNLDFFIRFYEEMEEENFSLVAEGSASGHVPTGDAWRWLQDSEADALYEIIRPYGMLIHVNDGIGEYANLGDTIKERVVTFLKGIAHQKTAVL